jgi:hypothetical protein|tara:strand:+ start:123 stop:629 length:507 start_codon:yes stop_codon:yes gene_type:complete
LPLDLANISEDRLITDEELILAYGQVLSALRTRGIIRTKNVVGELGEKYCEMTFCKDDALPNIELVPTNEKDIDARSNDGTTYSVKSATISSAKRTGAFHLRAEHELADKRFDYLLVAILNDTMTLTSIYQFSWAEFWSLKSWSKKQKAWFLSLSQKNLATGKLVFAE